MNKGSRDNNLLKNFSLILMGFIISLLLAEATVRIFPNKFVYFLGTKNSIVTVYNQDLGWIPAPQQKGQWPSYCFSVYPICINSFGFRDGPWKTGTGFKIAVLGDSYLQALQIPEGNYTSFILGRLLGQEVLNAANSGYGTIDELLAYKKLLKQRKPDITIIFFCSNDIWNNSCELNKLLGWKHSQACAYLDQGELKISKNFNHLPILKPRIPDCKLKRFIRKYCFSCVVMRRFIYKYSRNGLCLGTNFALPPVKEWGVYNVPPLKVWEDAWEITEKALSSLKKEVESSGGRLLVVSVSEYLRVSRNWRKEVKKELGRSEIPEGFDSFYPLKRLKDMLKKQGIGYFELEPYFREYRDRFGLEPPYFSYWCDGHWNPLGHFLAAHLVARYLLEEDLVPMAKEEKENRLKKINQDLELSPQEILGGKAYRQIYGRGIYKGSSNISEILQEN
ncbi:hypothetical protein D4R78_00740 [bacterium]|nr:MAG: hypothetical protein D4R78_00740 [bacterium]